MKLIYHISDASLHVRMEGMRPTPLWHRILNALAAAGYQVGRDPRIEKSYPTLGKTHRYGRHGHLEFKSDINDWQRFGQDKRGIGGGFEFKFFQNLVVKNKAGGEYDFSKLQKMPFLVRMRYQHALRLFVRMLDAEGFSNESDPDRTRVPALDQIRHGQKNSWHCKVDPITEWQPSDASQYNWKDADGNRLRPGHVRYFYHYSGHLMRATVYYSLNNMWYAVVGPRTVHSVCCNHFFAWRPGLTRRKPVDPVQKVEAALARAVKALDFERAIVCRNWLQARNIQPKAA